MNQYYSNFMNGDLYMDKLIKSSVSVADARNRANEYAKLFSRNEEMANFMGGSQPSLLDKTFSNPGYYGQRNFSGYAETPLLSTQYFNASVASYVSSFAGFMSVERDFDQPNGLFYWFDVLGVSNMRSVIPNLGPDNYQDIQTMGGFTTEVSPSTNNAVKDYQVITGRKIIPGTVRVKVTDGNASYELVDNGQGSLMAIANKITSSEINYLTGTVKFTVVANPTGTITIIGKEDTTGTPCNTNGASNSHANDKRFIAKMQQFGLKTVPDMLVAEYNIAALGALKKATQTDMATFLFTKLREMYTKCINYKLITTLEEGYTGDTMGTTANGFSLNSAAIAGQFYDYRSRVDLFDAFLIDVEAALAQKAVKGVNITAFVAGAKASNHFQKGGMIGKFEKNTKISYINDLIGWYDGIPVLRSTDINENEADGSDAVFYAIHKTEDGQMAPLARGIYMPLTDTPTVGNYQNPTQMAAGIYYQEGTKIMAPELVQRVAFKSGI